MCGISQAWHQHHAEFRPTDVKGRLFIVIYQGFISRRPSL
ncbi:hypothetical protein SUS17_431 [Sphingomonas sp. S17]|nr:hypothetical protein SUS17_431 [Sphingomonas sp. S17]